MGMLYQHGKKGIWWIKFYRNGKAFCESSHSTRKEDAQRLLAIREWKPGEGSLGGIPEVGEVGRNDRRVRVGTSGIRPRLLSLPEAARYPGGISVWTVRAMAWRGEIPEVRIGRRLLFDVQDLDSLVERNKWREEARTGGEEGWSGAQGRGKGV